MKKLYFVLLTAFFTTLSFSQVAVINEFDTDTPGTDVKEFIEIKTATPNFSMNGYVLVFFNGSDAKSYLRYDLDAYTSDNNGLLTIGNNAVSPLPDYNLPDNTLQNGPDGVAIYLGNGSNFPTGTLASTTNLMSALVYDTNDVDATILMTALGVNVQYNENQNGNGPTESIQRKADGTYEVKAPTPGANNDGSGQVFNGISFSITPTVLTEGSNFTITFTTQTPVTNDLNFTYSLANSTFNSSDFSGSLSVLIPVGSSSLTKTITLTDDTINEGDETILLTIGAIPANFNYLINNVAFRVHDNDFVVQPWGTPVNPTYGIVSSTATPGYYASLEGKSGAVLKQAIQDIIANPNLVREQNYGDAYDILKEADQNPENSSQVWLMYVEQPRSKLDSQSGTSGAAGFWNREHIYCQSRGGFSDATSATPDGIDVWSTTNADDIAAGHSDVHHIRAEDSPENSLRSERNYGVDYNGPAGNQGSWHGDVARAIFYMCIRYNGLNVVNGNPSENPDGFIGDLATLLTWNAADAADDYEMNRNNVVQVWQKNRNPFIDYPNLADYIWGSNAGTPWYSTLSTAKNFDTKISIYPNPAKDYISIVGLKENAVVVIYSTSGTKLYENNYITESKLNLNLAAGIYIAKITSENKTITRKIVIR
jgi:hypothetical protein